MRFHSVLDDWSLFSSTQIHVVFIDAAHDYASVRSDLERALALPQAVVGVGGAVAIGLKSCSATNFVFKFLIANFLRYKRCFLMFSLMMDFWMFTVSIS